MSKFSPEARARMSEGAKRRWARPEERALQSVRALNRTDEVKEAARQKMLVNWNDPEYRAMQELVRQEHLEWMKSRPSELLVSDGYLLWNRSEHPLAINTAVSEHRAVLFDKIGPGPHLCHWSCGKLLEWGGKEGICVDHLDGDTTNNDPENLVCSCIACNFRRGKLGNPIDWVCDYV